MPHRKAKRKNKVYNAKRRLKLSKTNPEKYYEETLKEVKKLKDDSDDLYKLIRERHIINLKINFLETEEWKSIITMEQMINRIDKVYGVKIIDNDDICNLITNYNYNHITYEIIPLLNKKQSRTFLGSKNKKSKNIQRRSIKSNNRKTNLDSKDIIIAHKIIDHLRIYLFNILTHIEQEINTYVINETSRRLVDEDEDKVKYVVKYYNKDIVGYYWDVIPKFTFGTLIEHMKQTKIEHGVYNYNTLTLLKDLRNQVSHWNSFWFYEQANANTLEKIIISNKNRYFIRNQNDLMKRTIDEIIMKYGKEKSNSIIERLSEFPLIQSVLSNII